MADIPVAVYIIAGVIGLQALVAYVLARNGTAAKKIAFVVTVIIAIYLIVALCLGLTGK